MVLTCNPECKTYNKMNLERLIDKFFDIVLKPFGIDLDSGLNLHEELFSKITTKIYLGSRPGENEVPDLKKAGISHVVSCLNEGERPRVEFLAHHFDHLFIGIHDGMQEDILSKFPQFFEFTANLMHGESTSRLLVHCESGVSRSATFVIALLMKLEKSRFFDTYKSVRARRPRVLPNIGFASQLQQLEVNSLIPDKIETFSSLALYLHQVCCLPADIDVIQSVLEQNDFDAVSAIMGLFDGEIPRVVQGVRL